jgi:hypothetical protein
MKDLFQGLERIPGLLLERLVTAASESFVMVRGTVFAKLPDTRAQRLFVMNQSLAPAL